MGSEMCIRDSLKVIELAARLQAPEQGAQIPVIVALDTAGQRAVVGDAANLDINVLLLFRVVEQLVFQRPVGVAQGQSAFELVNVMQRLPIREIGVVSRFDRHIGNDPRRSIARDGGNPPVEPAVIIGDFMVDASGRTVVADPQE